MRHGATTQNVISPVHVEYKARSYT